MIVDLERNDLWRVCVPGSVRWPELMVAESLAGVEHMVSTVEGDVRPGVGLAEILHATFPGGSITGAPKIAAVDLIAELEPVGRGASMGALGRVHGNGDLELALTIRTFAIADGRIHLWVGGGVVWDSDPSDEVAESLVKAAPLLDAIGAPLDGPVPAAEGGDERSADRGGRLRARARRPRAGGRRGNDEGFSRGRAAFETLRVYAGRPFRLDEHLARLAGSAERLGLPAPDAPNWGRALVLDTSRPGCGDLLRIYWTPGAPGAGPSAVVLASAVPDWIEAVRKRGQRLVTLAFPARSAAWLLPGTKSVSYATHVAAEAEAKRRGADDAVLRRPRRHRARGDGDERLVARGRPPRDARPRARDPRGRDARRAARARAGGGYAVETGAFGLERLLGADEVFTSSSVREVMPVASLDGRELDSRRAAEALQDALRRLAGAGTRLTTPEPSGSGRRRLRPAGATTGSLPSGHGEASPRRHGPPERGPRARPTTWGAAVRLPDGTIKAASGPKPRLALGGSIPLVRGPLRLAEAFAVLPAMKRGLPEARLPFERPVVGVALIAASTGATLARRSSLPVVPREAAVVIASLVPALIALRGEELTSYHGAEHVSIGTYETGERARRSTNAAGRTSSGPSRSRPRSPARPPSSSRHATGRPRASWARSVRSERRSRSSAGCRGTPTGSSRVRSPFPGASSSAGSPRASRATPSSRSPKPP